MRSRGGRATHPTDGFSFTTELFRDRLLLGIAGSRRQTTQSTVKNLESLLEIPEDRDFVEAAYQEILGRPADLAGLSGYLEALNRHVPRREILSRIAASTEAKAIRGRGTDTSRSRGPRAMLERAGNRLRGAAFSLVRRVLLTRFDVLDFKLGLLLDEFATGRDAMTELVRSRTADLEGRIAALEAALERGKAIDALPPQATANSPRRSIRVVPIEDFLIGVPAEEWRMEAFLRHRGWPEPGLVKVFRETVQPGMVVVDVGASFGFFTLLAARQLRGDGRIHSFEPAPSTFDLLKKNFQLNGFLESGIASFHQAAAADSDGSATLSVFADDSGHNTLFGAGDGDESVPVRTTRLDEALKGEARIDVVKIDAEGADLAVLRGMRRVIARNPNIRIFMEFAPSNLRRAGLNPPDVLAEIMSFELTTRRVVEPTGEIRLVSSRELCDAHSANLCLGREPDSDGGR